MCLPPTWPRFDCGLETICRMSLLVLCSVPRDFFQGTLVFPLHQKPASDSIWFDFKLILFVACSLLNHLSACTQLNKVA